ncbi:HK97 gp10 family phage protein [Aneurinibacillus thermoaerophilus]|uniref:HK97 gp10 family phage protein n=1 Tax=Aneurinibacillus thermoaerophilus TaxID=143495 RepID=UPI002E1C232D|nr:HK97 gp10 family phage protein [Aneurinibacillus thermoaerophilus]MED0765537.1 HK97 gp10 family phage protein [Aneurinibacillus thermoaerophilus]
MADGFVIEGLDQMHRQMLAFVRNNFPRAAEAWCEGLAMRLMERVASLAPVDKGRLRNAFITASMGQSNEDAFFDKIGRGGNVTILAGSNVSYADHVNTGHKLRNGEWWEGYHYFDDAWDEFEAEAIDWLADRLEELFNASFE